MPDNPDVRAAAAVSPTAIALNRFGLGARPSDSVSANPKVWLEQQFEHYDPLPAALQSLGNPQEQLAAAIEALREFREAAAGNRRPRENAGNTPAPNQNNQNRRAMFQAARNHYLEAVDARAHAALASNVPFLERLVHFWSNHFAVSMDKAPAVPFIPIFEATAIRPHVLGRFDDMLFAVERHPAMLLYLDQAQSAGPNSALARMAERRGAKRTPGLNENLAREILELHTLGARSGYSQDDVTEFARALTGWSIDGVGPRAERFPARFGNRGGIAKTTEPSADGFVFRPGMHEPGSRTILGHKYTQEGESQARAILHDVAAAPATAKHIATKLAMHFAGDTPPQALVDRLTMAFQKSNGDLPALYRVLIDSPETWAPTAVKFKNPWEWIISALRGCGVDRVDDRQLSRLRFAPLLQQLGQPVWRPGSPAGWDDTSGTWAAPDALLRRVELAQRFATAVSRMDRSDPGDLAQHLLPGSVGGATEAAIKSADSHATALALLLVSPEFQRR